MGKNEKKVYERSSESKVMTILLGVSLFCIFSLFLLSIFNHEWLTGKVKGFRVESTVAKDDEGIDEDEQNDVEVNLDFDKIEADLLGVVDEENKIMFSHCTNCEVIDYDNSTEAICSDKELSKETITKVVDKLRSSNHVIYLPTSKPCATYTYYIGRYLVIFESDDNNSLLVGLNGEGYAFEYDESVIPFLEELGNME